MFFWCSYKPCGCATRYACLSPSFRVPLLFERLRSILSRCIRGPAVCSIASVKSFLASSTLSPFGGLSRVCFATAAATSCLLSKSAVRHCTSMRGFFTVLTQRLQAKRTRSLTEEIMTVWLEIKEKGRCTFTSLTSLRSCGLVSG